MTFWGVPGMKPGVITGDLAWSLLQHAKENKYAIPAFNCTTTSSINSVLEAGKDLNRPVIVQMSEGGAAFFAGKSLPNDKGVLQASILGAVCAAHYVRQVAPAYGVPVLSHSDHCAKKLLPWFDGMLEFDESFFKTNGEPLFSSHMLDLSEEPDEENIAICAKYLTRMAPMKQILEMEIGITGGVEDGVDNSGVAKDKLYSTPQDVYAVYEKLNPISHMFTIAAAFGNVHGVYKAGNVVLQPNLLNDFQLYAAEKTGKPNPLYFVFHGGSGSEKKDINTALHAGVVKMNVDTDTQWAYWEGILKFYKAKEGYLQGQIGNPEGPDKPNKSYYDPRKWVRESELSMLKRVKESCADLGNTNGAFALQAHPKIPKVNKPTVVCILDGWGDNEVKDEYNAVHAAKTPNYDRIFAVEGRARTVKAHGPAVGLPTWDDMGNSEVGHNALGSGQVVAQGAKLVDNAIATGSMFTGAGWKYIEPAFASNTVHLIGLLSKGGVHARYGQMIDVLKGLQRSGAKKIRLHLLTDGRDVPDGTSVEYAAELEVELAALRGAGVDVQVASGGGRMYVTMDRYDCDWSIVERGWKAHVLGEAPHYFTSLDEAVATLTKSPGDKGSDQFLDPFVIKGADGQPVGPVQDNDAVVIFNFRADRVAQLSKAFEYPDFNSFDRVRYPKVKFVGMMQYDGDLGLPANYLVDAPEIRKVSGEYLVNNGIRTWACSETQKFGHVTFFWNGNKSGFIDETLEDFKLIESDRVVFDQKPKMKAREITDAAKEAVNSGKYQMIRVNYANPDMVGHTGNLAATIEACEFTDACLGELLACIEAAGGRWLVTSDHGNADEMVQRNKKSKAPLKDGNGAIMLQKAHTLAPVPVCIGGDLPKDLKFRTDMPDAGLANITGTYMNMVGLTTPEGWVPSLI